MPHPRGSFGRIGYSFITAIGGVVLISGSLILLVYSEGRAVHKAQLVDEAADNTISVKCDSVDPDNEGQLVYFTGTTAGQTLTDPMFGISVDAIRLYRNVEMYQWKEKTDRYNKVIGGYEKVWWPSLIGSADFKDRSKVNPSVMRIKSDGWFDFHVKVGGYTLPGNLVQLMKSTPLPLPDKLPEGLPREIASDAQLSGGACFVAGQPGRPIHPGDPQIGDLKITLRVVKPGPVSVIGKQVGTTVADYIDGNGIYITAMLSPGTIAADQMFRQAKRKSEVDAWIMPVICFPLIWLGLVLILCSLSVWFDVAGMLRRIVGAGIGPASFVFAAVGSCIFIAISWIAYRPFFGAASLAIAAVAPAYMIFRARLAAARRGGATAGDATINRKCPMCGCELRGNSDRCPGCRTGVRRATNAEILAWFAEPPPRRVRIKGGAVARLIVFRLLMLLMLLLLLVFGCGLMALGRPNDGVLLFCGIVYLILAIICFATAPFGRSVLSRGTAVVGQVTRKDYSVGGGDDQGNTYWIWYHIQRHGVQTEQYCTVDLELYERSVVGQDIVIVIAPGKNKPYDLFDKMDWEPYRIKFLDAGEAQSSVSIRQPQPPPQQGAPVAPGTREAPSRVTARQPEHPPQKRQPVSGFVAEGWGYEDDDEDAAASPELVRLEMEKQLIIAARRTFQLDVEYEWAAIIERFDCRIVNRDSQGNDKFSCVIQSPQCLIKTMKSPAGTAIFFGGASIHSSEYPYSDAPGPLWTNWNDLKRFLHHKYPNQPLDLPRPPTGSEKALEELMAAYGEPRPAQWWAEYEQFQAECKTNDGV